MTAVAASPGPGQATDERRALWAIARYESLRLVRHPVFLIAALLFIYGTVSTPFNEYANAEYRRPAARRLLEPRLHDEAAFLLGLGGLIAMNRITSSSGALGPGAGRGADVGAAAHPRPVPGLSGAGDSPCWAPFRLRRSG